MLGRVQPNHGDGLYQIFMNLAGQGVCGDLVRASKMGTMMDNLNQGADLDNRDLSAMVDD